ncbi:MAG: hypothetical protein KBF49_01370, partial [Flavobacteriales bacterium]|nr:hypothetical protein [Flavobacteriales bacterium]
DNGVGRGHSSKTKGSPAHRSLGMQLTDERLRLLSRRLGGSGSVEVEDLLNVAGVPSGTCVTLHLGMVD